MPESSVSHQGDIHAAIASRKNLLRGKLSAALMELGKATTDLGNAIRISPMKGVDPAVEAGIEHAFASIGTARTKMKAALEESHAIANLETELDA